MKTITKDMPEPKDDGLYLVTWPNGEMISVTHRVFNVGGSAWFLDDWMSWPLALAALDGNNLTIESLAEHDEHIRREALANHGAEALRLTDRELACVVNGFIAAGIMDYPIKECINYAIRNVRLLREGQVSHEQGNIDLEADHE